MPDSGGRSSNSVVVSFYPSRISVSIRFLNSHPGQEIFIALWRGTKWGGGRWLVRVQSRDILYGNGEYPNWNTVGSELKSDKGLVKVIIDGFAWNSVTIRGMDWRRSERSVAPFPPEKKEEEKERKKKGTRNKNYERGNLSSLNPVSCPLPRNAVPISHRCYSHHDKRGEKYPRRKQFRFSRYFSNSKRPSFHSRSSRWILNKGGNRAEINPISIGQRV